MTNQAQPFVVEVVSAERDEGLFLLTAAQIEALIADARAPRQTGIEWRVWWIPQIPMEAFRVAVPDLETGILLCDVLASYDRFQFEHRVKPDYSNVGGISWRHPDLTEGEWEDVNPSDPFEMEELRERIMAI